MYSSTPLLFHIAPLRNSRLHFGFGVEHFSYGDDALGSLFPTISGVIRSAVVDGRIRSVATLFSYTTTILTTLVYRPVINISYANPSKLSRGTLDKAVQYVRWHHVLFSILLVIYGVFFLLLFCGQAAIRFKYRRIGIRTPGAGKSENPTAKVSLFHPQK